MLQASTTGGAARAMLFCGWSSLATRLALRSATSCGSGPLTAGRGSGGLFAPTQMLLESKKRYRTTGQRQTKDDAVNPLTRPSNIDKGALHVVSVPIGNLKDFSLRALEVLRNVDYIVCTNRQSTKYLLDLVDVDASGKLIHYRSNGNAKLIEMLRGGRSMALVAPSGTPCIGDGGSDLVREMLANGVRVTSVPGPCAVTCALSISGAFVGSDGAFYFGGTLPERQGARARVLRQCAVMSNPSVFYEYPRRVLAVLHDIRSVMPTRNVSIIHELTKLHESLHRDTPQRLIEYYSKSEALRLLSKGQLVLVLEGAPFVDQVDDRTGQSRDATYYKLVEGHLASAEGDVWAASKLVALSLEVPQATVMDGYHAWKEHLSNQAKQKALPNVPQNATLTGKALRQRRRARRRQLLIRRIERKQEQLRLSMAAQEAHLQDDRKRV